MALRWLKETLARMREGDKTREDLCAYLRGAGIQARLAERNRPEEQNAGLYSLGLIDIGEGPISWMNLREVRDSDHVVTGRELEYGVPDARNLPKVWVRSVRVKTFPGVRWEGEDSGLGIMDFLNDAASRSSILADSGQDLAIRTRPQLYCWTITEKGWAGPSPELWSCYQTIARHLIADWAKSPEEISLDNTRGELCDALCAIGVRAVMAEGDPPQKSTAGPFGLYSLGLINIGEGPIRWVNIARDYDLFADDWGGRYMIEYGVPDPRDLLDIRLQSVRDRTLPLLGRSTGVHWQGKDQGLRLIARLNGASVADALMDAKLDLTIQSLPTHGCWVIAQNGRAAPAAELWSCYQTIAGHLLADWEGVGQ
jgi:hypothetical protein